MRTNIVLDDELVMRAQRLTGIKTKRELVDKALRMLVRLQEQSEMLELRGKIHWDGDLDSMRGNRIYDRS